jgi:K+-transporting ATPase KdpF subunit
VSVGMDYMIAAVVAALVFGYLVDALLHPEKY